MKRSSYSLALFSVCCLILSSCGPRYQTDYIFSAPPTQQGKMCAQDCVNKLPICKNTCDVKRAACVEDQKEKAEQAYFEYLKKQKAAEEIATKDQDDFVNTSMCHFRSCEDDCDNQQRICHVNCGGQVTTHRYCVANCDKV